MMIPMFHIIPIKKNSGVFKRIFAKYFKSFTKQFLPSLLMVASTETVFKNFWFLWKNSNIFQKIKFKIHVKPGENNQMEKGYIDHRRIEKLKTRKPVVRHEKDLTWSDKIATYR